MRCFSQSVSKLRAALLITGLICCSLFPHLSCEKDSSDPNQDSDDALQDTQDNMPSCWTELDDLNKKRNSHMIAALENRIYVTGGGGTDPEDEYNGVYLYDPACDSSE